MLDSRPDAAERMYPGVTYDYALPHDWVRRMEDLHEVDVRPHFVWGYEGSLIGYPLPITTDGAQMMYRAYNDLAYELKRYKPETVTEE